MQYSTTKYLHAKVAIHLGQKHYLSQRHCWPFLRGTHCLNLQREESKDFPNLARRHTWTKTHSAYAVMGGFAFDAGNRPDHLPLPQGRSRLTLSSEGLTFLAEKEPQLIPDISEQELSDKSKSNGLAKFLVCTQAIWFCVQFIWRLADLLPVTLLELNTFAHCLCALTVYALWWNKPFDVEEPTLIPAFDGTARGICAAMCMRSSIGRRIPSPRRVSEKDVLSSGILGIGNENASMHDHDDGRSESPERLHKSESTTSKATTAVSQDSLDTTLALELEQMEHGHIYRRTIHGKILHDALDFLHLNDGNQSMLQVPSGETLIQIPRETLRLCSEARDAMQQYRLFSDGEQKTKNDTDKNRPGRPDVEWLWTHSSNSPVGILLQYKDTWRAILWAFLFFFFYGGFHMLAWESPFHTDIEDKLWKISALSLVVIPVLLGIIASFPITPSIQPWELPFHSGWVLVLNGLYWTVYVPLVICMLALWITCRVYIVVESFLSLPYASASTFVQPSWPAHFPHIG